MSACGFATVGWSVPMWASGWFVCLRRVKTLSWLSTRTGDGDALGRHFLLEGVVLAVLPLLRPETSGGTPRSSMDRTRAALRRRIPLGASSWMFCWPEGPVDVWWSAAAIFSSSARWCVALGPVWMLERRLRSRLRCVALRCVGVGLSCLGGFVVDLWGAWPAASVDVGAAAPDSASAFALRASAVALRGVGLGRLGG